MTKVNLTLGESKTKVDLALESKNVGLQWDKATWTWDSAHSLWKAPKISGSLETKTKNNLSLETK